MGSFNAPFTLVKATLPIDAGGGTDPGGGGDGDIENPLAVTLTSPANGDTVATALPQFVVAVDSDDEDDDAIFIVELQIADNQAMTNARTVTLSFDALDAGIYYTPTTPVPTTTWWRARVLQQDGEPRSGWTDAISFTVSVDISVSVLTVTWTVDTNGPRSIHLWHFDPPGPDHNDKVTIYGQGFPTSGTVTFGDVPLEVSSWNLIAASDNAEGEDRAIRGRLVDPEHYEVVFTAPVYNGPGEPLTVGV